MNVALGITALMAVTSALQMFETDYGATVFFGVGGVGVIVVGILIVGSILSLFLPGKFEGASDVDREHLKVS